MVVGQNIRMVRKRRGLTLDELSGLCGISRDDLGQYERGQMTPRPGTVAKIAQALDVPIVAISGGMGWSAPEAAEQWEAAEGDPLRDGILEAVAATSGGAFVPVEEDVRLLMEAVKAAIPSLVERMKDTRPEAEVNRALLAELALGPEDGGEGLAERYALTDGQWEQIAPLLPPEKSGRGRAFKSNRLMLDGIIYHIRSGTAWKDLPERFGRHKCVSGRLRLWREAGVWEPVRAKLAALGVIDGVEDL